jgi:hypothetical protein
MTILNISDEIKNFSSVSAYKMKMYEIKLISQNYWIPAEDEQLTSNCDSILDIVLNERGSFFYDILLEECKS